MSIGLNACQLVKQLRRFNHVDKLMVIQLLAIRSFRFVVETADNNLTVTIFYFPLAHLRGQDSINALW